MEHGTRQVTAIVYLVCIDTVHTYLNCTQRDDCIMAPHAAAGTHSVLLNHSWTHATEQIRDGAPGPRLTSTLPRLRPRAIHVLSSFRTSREVVGSQPPCSAGTRMPVRDRQCTPPERRYAYEVVTSPRGRLKVGGHLESD